MASSSRYNSFDSQTSSSSEFTKNNNSKSRALARTKASDPVSMVKKFIMDKRSKPAAAAALFIPADFIAQDLKKTQSNKFSSFHRKLFHSDSDEKDKKSKKKKASLLPLTEVKSNTRTLAMVLRSERDLLNQNKEQDTHIADLKLLLDHKNTEIDKLKDLCLEQREEIQQLKNAILFPPEPKRVIPTLQRQVTSLTDQLQCLADDLAQVKADKSATRDFFGNSHAISVLDQEATDSLEFSSEETTLDSPDDIFFQDFNPCLTPYSIKSKYKEFDEVRGYNPRQVTGFKGVDENRLQGKKLSKNFEYCSRPSLDNISTRIFPLYSEKKGNSTKPTWHQSC